MSLRAKKLIAELEARIEELEAQVAGEKAKGVLLQKRAERAEAAASPPKPAAAKKATAARKAAGK